YRHLLHRIADRETRRLRAWRELLEAFQPLRDHGLRRHEQECPMRLPVAVVDAVSASLERIGPQILEIGSTQLGEVALPNSNWSLGVGFGVLLHEGDLPFADAECHQVAVVTPVEEFLARRFL